LALAIEFGLLAGKAQYRTAGRRLVELVRESNHRINTGFVGTPLICDALADAGAIDDAYHLLLQTECPSWLYPVTMGATTVWERWDSMLPNGQVNPGEMTSFNHYALGAVGDFLHRRVAGLAPAAPGYRRLLIQPLPGGGLTFARTEHRSLYGPCQVEWHRDGESFQLTATVPLGVTATVVMPDAAATRIEVGSGTHLLMCRVRPPEEDPKAPRRINIHNPAEAVHEAPSRESFGVRSAAGP
jgi:alpha-L-rhamnosidase